MSKKTIKSEPITHGTSEKRPKSPKQTAARELGVPRPKDWKPEPLPPLEQLATRRKSCCLELVRELREYLETVRFRETLEDFNNKLDETTAPFRLSSICCALDDLRDATTSCDYDYVRLIRDLCVELEGLCQTVTCVETLCEITDITPQEIETLQRIVQSGSLMSHLFDEDEFWCADDEAA